MESAQTNFERVTPTVNMKVTSAHLFLIWVFANVRSYSFLFTQSHGICSNNHPNESKPGKERDQPDVKYKLIIQKNVTI